MKKIIVLFLVLLWIVTIYLYYSIQTLVKSSQDEYYFSYTGIAYQWENLLSDYYITWYVVSWDVVANHKMVFYSLDIPVLGLDIYTQSNNSDTIINIKNSSVLHSTGNNWIDLFDRYVLQKHLNENIHLSNMTWINYTIYKSKDIFSKNITLQFDFINQYNNKNTMYIKSKMRCWIWLYLNKVSSCNITSIIDFDLPINSKINTITLSWNIDIIRDIK